MKRTLSILLVLVLCLSIVLTACDGEGETQPVESSSESETGKGTEKETNSNTNNGGDTSGGNTSGGNNGGTTNGGNTSDDNNGGNTSDDGTTDGGEDEGLKEPVVKTVYALEKQLAVDSVSQQIETYMSNGTIQGTEYVTGVAPFVLYNNLGLGDAKITSITIPVKSTRTAVDGNFYFTLSIYPKLSSQDEYKTAQPIRKVRIKISAAAYGLENGKSNVNRLIKVDLTEYDFYIKSNETLGFGTNSTAVGEADTLLPMWFNSSNVNDATIRNYLSQEIEVMKGFYSSVGRDGCGKNDSHCIYFDFTYEKNYDTEAQYKAAVEEAFTENGNKYTLDAPYWPEGVYEKVKAAVESGSFAANCFQAGGAPFVPERELGLTNSKLTSISIPVYKVTEADANENYVFTISVCNFADKDKANAPIQKYKIYISKAEYGFTDNQDVMKMIDVDLTPYNIVLDADDTLGFCNNGDTLLPIYTSVSNGINSYASDLFAKWHYFYLSVGGTGAPSYDKWNMIFFDFTYERTYTSTEDFIKDAEFNVNTVVINSEFDQMLEAVKNAYGGLNLSIMGDSISTYEGVSNNTNYNSTIGNNAVWYRGGNITKAGLTGSQDTYWGRLMASTGMKLCVNNAWSGASLCGNDDNPSKKAFFRAQQLHNNKAGISPDVIIVYCGINDTWGSGREVGELYTLLQNKGNKTDAEVVEAWFEKVLAKAETLNFQDKWGTSYSSWSEAYALMLYLMSEQYSDSVDKIALVTLTYNGSNSNYASSNKWVPQYNVCIRALAEYFGMLVVEQQNVINKDNFAQYMQKGDPDADGVTERLIHPNTEGHRVLYEEIIRTLYKDLKNKK